MPQSTQFGRAKRQAPITPKRILAPRDLPAKGIHFHPNYLRKLWTKRENSPSPLSFCASHRVDEEVIDQWIADKLAGGA